MLYLVGKLFSKLQHIKYLALAVISANCSSGLVLAKLTFELADYRLSKLTFRLAVPTTGCM